MTCVAGRGGSRGRLSCRFRLVPRTVEKLPRGRFDVLSSAVVSPTSSKVRGVADSCFTRALAADWVSRESSSAWETTDWLRRDGLTAEDAVLPALPRCPDFVPRVGARPRGFLALGASAGVSVFGDGMIEGREPRRPAGTARAGGRIDFGSLGLNGARPGPFGDAGFSGFLGVLSVGFPDHLVALPVIGGRGPTAGVCGLDAGRGRRGLGVAAAGEGPFTLS